MTQKLRKSSSLILFKENHNTLECLLLQRKISMSFSKMYVFPGGVCQANDKINNNFYQYGKITALRETYQQSGLVILPENYQIENICQITSKEEFSKKLRQVWSRQETLRQIIPVFRILTIHIPNMKRYDCIFYVISSKLKIYNYQLYKSTNQTDSLTQLNQIKHNQESLRSVWMNPGQSLLKNAKKQVELAIPQMIILSCLSKFQNYKQLEYHSRRITDIQPILLQYSQESGYFLLPGDKLYDMELTISAEPESQSKTQLEESFKILRNDKASNMYRLKLKKTGIVEFIQLNKKNISLLSVLIQSEKL